MSNKVVAWASKAGNVITDDMRFKQPGNFDEFNTPLRTCTFAEAFVKTVSLTDRTCECVLVTTPVLSNGEELEAWSGGTVLVPHGVRFLRVGYGVGDAGRDAFIGDWVVKSNTGWVIVLKSFEFDVMLGGEK